MTAILILLSVPAFMIVMLLIGLGMATVAEAAGAQSVEDKFNG